jgi:hypothetical protein
VINCPNCGTKNPDGSRFCAECGADLRSLGAPRPDSESKQTPSVPTQYATAGEVTERPAWSPVPSPPPTAPQRRRTWLWVVLGIVGACILCCCLTLVWANTIGQGDVNNLLTRVSDELTNVAPTPTIRR